MTDPIKDIITAIDKKLSNSFTGKYYGLCELINSQGERYPVTVTPTNRERVNPADTWQLQIYSRLGDGLRVPEEEFGRNIVLDQSVRMVVISNPNLGESLPLRLMASLPGQIKVVGGSGVLLEAMNLGEDHETIASTEFGAMPEDKHRLVKNLFVITYSLRLSLCQ